MKNLFLASSFKDVVELFVDSAGCSLRGKTVTFIPTASINEQITYYVDAGRKALEKQGLVIDTLEISTAPAAQISSKLRTNDFIYMSGGNVFFLLQALRKSATDTLLLELINAGKPYIGESAGSIILAADIEYAKAMDDATAVPELSDYASLGLIDIFPVPHFGNFPFKESAKQIVADYGDKIQLCPISNAQAILIKGDQFEVLSK